MESKKKQFVIAALRRASYRWWGRYTAMQNSRVGRNQYVCEQCGPEKTYGRKDIQLDHKLPIVPVEGFKDGSDFDLNEYVERLLCDDTGFSVLCKEHHEIKTKGENEVRRANKAAKKPPKKK